MIAKFYVSYINMISIVATVCFLGILLLAENFLDCDFQFSYSIAMWPASLWFTILGVLTYVNKFYKVFPPINMLS